MMNNRPIDDPDLQAALSEFQALLQKYGLAGACILVAPEESAFTYGMHAPWSAIRPDALTPLGFRIKASSSEGAAGHKRLEGAVHTICQMSDFGAMTMDWMEQLKQLLRKSGVEFDHVPFNGKPLPSLGTRQ